MKLYIIGKIRSSCIQNYTYWNDWDRSKGQGIKFLRALVKNSFFAAKMHKVHFSNLKCAFLKSTLQYGSKGISFVGLRKKIFKLTFWRF